MCEIASFGEGGTEEFEVIAMVKHVDVCSQPFILSYILGST